MNALIIHGGNADTLTMSSLEISGLVDSRHDKVKQSIERLVERGIIVQPPMGEVPNDGPGPKIIAGMNALTIANTADMTMSSQEIAELTGKEHRNVMRDIRAMLAELHGDYFFLKIKAAFPGKAR